MPVPQPAVQSIAALSAHYRDAVLRPWSPGHPGWNPSLQLAYESLDGTTGQPWPVQRYRAMACARQLYVFAEAGNLEHAQTLFMSLCQRFGDGAGGWHYSIGPDGKPLDTTRDLYTYAFVIFASAAWYRASGSAEALTVLRQTTGVVEQRFADGDGLYRAALREDFSEDPAVQGANLLQNPIMHLTEAYLAALAATGDGWFAIRLRQLSDAVFRRFVDPANGCVAELPTGAADNRIEPGHQFEWFSLLASAPEVFDGSPLAAAMPQAFAFGRQHGVASDTMGVCAAVAADGSLRDGTQRIWAQTEFGRALALRCAGGDAAAQADLLAWLPAFRQRFLHAGGWHEVLAADGTVARADMPSTTPYHLVTAVLALDALAAG